METTSEDLAINDPVAVQEFGETMWVKIKTEERRRLTGKNTIKNLKNMEKSIETHLKSERTYIWLIVWAHHCGIIVGQSLISTKHTRYYKSGARYAFT